MRSRDFQALTIGWNCSNLASRHEPDDRSFMPQPAIGRRLQLLPRSLGIAIAGRGGQLNGRATSMRYVA